MAYDVDLADRLRDAIGHLDGVTEKRMFGGVAFLLGGHLAVSASSRGGLLLRCDPAATDRLVSGHGVTRFEMRGREMNGWLHVDPDVVADDAALADWVAVGTTFASGLPPKE